LDSREFKNICRLVVEQGRYDAIRVHTSIPVPHIT
jgi:hypothetical protein